MQLDTLALSNDSPLACYDSGAVTASALGPKGYGVDGSDSKCFRWCSCACQLVSFVSFSQVNVHSQLITYIWRTAVGTPADLRLINIDENSWVAKRPSTAIA
jgi:hypothetical protein